MCKQASNCPQGSSISLLRNLLYTALQGNNGLITIRSRARYYVSMQHMRLPAIRIALRNFIVPTTLMPAQVRTNLKTDREHKRVGQLGANMGSSKDDQIQPKLLCKNGWRIRDKHYVSCISRPISGSNKSCDRAVSWWQLRVSICLVQ